jgi:hypothetical protein
VLIHTRIGAEERHFVQEVTFAHFRFLPVPLILLVADAVTVEPVSTRDFLLTGKLTGNFADSDGRGFFLRPAVE